jgi:hypothetical protein
MRAALWLRDSRWSATNQTNKGANHESEKAERRVRGRIELQRLDRRVGKLLLRRLLLQRLSVI